jgi:hypothetical protein
VTTNLDAFAAQVFKEWRRLSDNPRAEWVRRMRVSNALDLKIVTDPEEAWPLVLAIVDRAATSTEEHAADWALELFLDVWGAEFGDQVAAEARRSPKFAAAIAIHNRDLEPDSADPESDASKQPRKARWRPPSVRPTKDRIK